MSGQGGAISLATGLPLGGSPIGGVPGYLIDKQTSGAPGRKTLSMSEVVSANASGKLPGQPDHPTMLQILNYDATGKWSPNEGNVTPYTTVDPGFNYPGLQKFLSTEQGAPFSKNYTPGTEINQVGLSDGSNALQNSKGEDVSAMLAAYNSWTGAMNDQKTQWQRYADLASANQGGQGDQTITVGAAVGQREMLLGALANAGNPTTPTPGLGTLGTLMANGVPVK